MLLRRIWGGLTLAISLSLGHASLESAAIAQTKPIEGIGPAGNVVKVQGGFQFLEGPASDGRGNLYFTDVAGNKIHKLDGAGRVSVFLDPSNHCNGLMFAGPDRLLACEMDGRLLAIEISSKQVSALAEAFDGKRFNAPNDLVIDRSGGVYFTDPRFRAPQPWPQGKEAVYYRAADGSVTRLVDDLPAPNGVILSVDEKTLYVIPSMQKEMMAYDVKAPGKLGPGRVFCSLAQPQNTAAPGGGGDGLTIDTQGNLYITSRLGVQVFNPSGKLLGIIEFPEQPANVTFGGADGKTLYATARTSLYSVPMHSSGHQFPGKLRTDP